MSRVDIQHVTKRYGTFAALDNVSITFNDGEFFGLLGPSGSGKTTLLRSIAGFITPDEGTISFDGEQVENVPVHRRAIGMVFQSYALFPHLTIGENIGFGLDVRGIAREDIRKRVAEMLSLVRLAGLEGRYPRQLSGGQQQRVALARALITKPKVLLLDEPLGALDRRLRQEMQVELKDIQRETGITAIFVTHDQEEALTLSDRIAIIDQGRLIQVDSPHTVYERPTNIFAANFLGDANVFRGTPVPEGLRLADGTIIATFTASTGAAIVRPEKLRVTSGHTKCSGNSLQGEIIQAIYSGASVTYRIRTKVLGETPLLAFIQNQTGEVLDTGASVTVNWDKEQTIPVNT
ncbi:ABC transporter ATP-binding protein [Nordella sp. HKS 07]|uniref:ABC transporter ATP-binding protein n=1 Tax=Nordella sp. HKS 07 TaxID=2712222 RepID=UPI0013E1A3E4|nr:ABC transporter ATP-binding protein [Nordella sp. HKS 07]QIG47886.1 ABC transporter ATP-binding protein [Nordella sp. HKS 07]